MAAEAAAVATQGNSEPEAEAAQGFAAVAEVAVLVLGKDVAAIDLDFVFDFHIAKRGFFGVGVGSCIVQTTADSQSFLPRRPEKA